MTVEVSKRELVHKSLKITIIDGFEGLIVPYVCTLDRQGKFLIFMIFYCHFEQLSIKSSPPIGYF